MLNKEKEYYSDEVRLIAGTDEAGRGPLAGPVFAAAVIFPRGYVNDEINDSKKLTAKRRDELFDLIKKDALAYGIASVSAKEIDEINIYEASRKAMMMALDQLSSKPDLILTDAMPLPSYPIKSIPIIKGDAKALCIAGASILAKVSRDRYMDELEKQYPDFLFSKHKGYGTKAHLQELDEHGPIEGVHRYSYEPVRERATSIWRFI